MADDGHPVAPTGEPEPASSAAAAEPRSRSRSTLKFVIEDAAKELIEVRVPHTYEGAILFGCRWCTGFVLARLMRSVAIDGASQHSHDMLRRQTAARVSPSQNDYRSTTADKQYTKISELTQTFTILQAVMVIGWLIFFNTRDWDTTGLRATAMSNLTKDSILAVASILLVCFVPSSSYGNHMRDRGWLMMAFVLDLTFLNVIHVGYDNTVVRIFSFFNNVAMLATAVCIWLQLHLIDEIDAVRGSADKRTFFSVKCDLPDQTPETMKKWGFVLSGCFFVVGVALAASAPGTFSILRGVAYILVAGLGGYATHFAYPRAHRLAYTLGVVMLGWTYGTLPFAIQMNASQHEACDNIVYTNTSYPNIATLHDECTGNASKADAHTVFIWLAMICVVLFTWYHRRMTSLVPPDEPGSTEATMCLVAKPADLAQLTRQLVLFVVTPMILIMGIVTVSIGHSYIEYGVEKGMRNYSISYATALITVALVMAFASYMQYRWALTMAVVLTEGLFSLTYIGMAYTTDVVGSVELNNVPPVTKALGLDQRFLELNPVTDDEVSSLQGILIIQSLMAVVGGIGTFLLEDDFAERESLHRVAAVNVAKAADAVLREEAMESSLTGVEVDAAEGGGGGAASSSMRAASTDEKEEKPDAAGAATLAGDDEEEVGEEV